MVEANPAAGSSQQQQSQYNKLQVQLTTFNFTKDRAKKFQTKDFWSDFFKAKQIDDQNQSTDMESFEWYADFEDLLPHFQAGLIEGDA